MRHPRSGTSLGEVLFALVIIAMSASLALQAAMAAARALGTAHGRTDAAQRATLALATLHSLPCDSTAVARLIAEPRWQLTAVRRSRGQHRADEVVLQSRRGDTITMARHQWCSP